MAKRYDRSDSARGSFSITKVTITGKCDGCGSSATASGYGERGERIAVTGSCVNGHEITIMHIVD